MHMQIDIYIHEKNIHITCNNSSVWECTFPFQPGKLFVACLWQHGLIDVARLPFLLLPGKSWVLSFFDRGHAITMVINHLLNGMILQWRAPCFFSGDLTLHCQDWNNSEQWKQGVWKKAFLLLGLSTLCFWRILGLFSSSSFTRKGHHSWRPLSLPQHHRVGEGPD